VVLRVDVLDEKGWGWIECDVKELALDDAESQHRQIEAVKHAFADVYRYVADARSLSRPSGCRTTFMIASACRRQCHSPITRRASSSAKNF
jgi:gamma-glutamyltranspeptidase